MSVYVVGGKPVIVATTMDRREGGWIVLDGAPGVSSPVTKKDTATLRVVGEFDSYVSVLVFLRDLDRKRKGLRLKDPEWLEPGDSIPAERSFRSGSIRRVRRRSPKRARRQGA